jgi:exodeoxyribonuclease VII large subunit
LNVLSRRYPLVEVVLSPTPVQGEAAPAAIARALAISTSIPPATWCSWSRGGSMEDLWAFNTEQMVRAVAALQAPVISGIGRGPTSSGRLRRDRRAPHHSAAAELAL